MKIEIIRLENQLMESNCFIVLEHDSKSCVIIDPASEKAECEIEIIEDKNLHLDYVIITHTHADHCWGVNALKKRYPEVKIVYHEDKYKAREIMLFFRMWHEDVNYTYELEPADYLIKDGQVIDWHGHRMKFISTPGHSVGSICLDIEGKLFTGDTIMPFPPYFNGRGSNKKEWAESVKVIVDKYSPKTIIYPGHGDLLTLGEWMANDVYTRCK